MVEQGTQYNSTFNIVTPFQYQVISAEDYLFNSFQSHLYSLLYSILVAIFNCLICRQAILGIQNNIIMHYANSPFHESVYIEYSDLDQLEIKSINAQNNPLKAPPPRHSLFYIYHELDKDLKVELQCKVGSRANVSAKVGQVIGGNMSQIDYGCGYALTLIKNKTAVIDLDLSQDGEDDFVIIRILNIN